VDLRSLFEEGLLQAAVVVDRRGSEQAFLTLTATNLADVPAWQGAER
jgi:coenzyme F420-reducing hydrogenase beta subunit